MSILTIFVLTSIITLFLWLLFGKKRTSREKKIDSDNPVNLSEKIIVNDSSLCCGQHSECDLNRLRNKISKERLYFNDEELDQYQGCCSPDYSDEDIEQFRYVLYTMRQEEVMDWVDSLQKREIELPDPIKAEARMLMNEK